MIILHSWGGCGKRLLKASSSPAQDRRRSCPLGTPLGRQCPPGRARSSLLAPGRGRSCFASGAGGEKPGAAGCLGMLLVLPCTSRPGKAPTWWGEGSGCSSIAPLRLRSGAPAICFPGLIVVSFPIQFPDFNFFCLCQAASNLFAIITSCSRSSVNSAAQAPGEMLVCCPWSRAPGDRCAFLPPSTPACSPDPTAPLPTSKAAGLGQHCHRGHLLPPWMGVTLGKEKARGC